jgi:Copper amine oxidase, enzyme domain
LSGRRPAASLIAMRIALPRLARFSLFALFLLLPERGFAAYCSSGSELTQDFPSSGAAVSRWHLCWEIVRLPGPDGVTPRSETLAISKAEFRPGATAPSVEVLGDLRMAEIFVPYHPGYPRFHDMSDAAFDLQPISTTECKGTRLGANRLCEEIVDRGLAWRDPYVPTARRGEKLVLWSILNASNYDYVMHYEFHDDGTIEVRAGSTGRKLGGPDDPTGHFHNFSWRIDLDIDGPGGDTASIESARVSRKVKESSTALANEQGVKWDLKAFTHLEVSDATSVNARGRNRAYTLVPLVEGTTRFPETWTKFPIWVTRSHGPTAELLARYADRYASDREPVAGTDLVLWYTGSHNHESNMRDEDRDTVPVAWVGFRLEPKNVWDGTPFYR